MESCVKKDQTKGEMGRKNQRTLELEVTVDYEACRMDLLDYADKFPP